MTLVQLLEQIEKRLDGRLDDVQASVKDGLDMVHGRLSASERRATAEHDEVKAAVADLAERVDRLEGVVDWGRGVKGFLALVVLDIAASAVLERLPT